MKTFSCLIIEDSEQDLRAFQQALAQIPLLKKTDVCASTEDALGLLAERNYDLIFLDMRLPGESGLEWLQNSPHRPPVIVTTGYPDYAVDCYDLTVVDYLLKPISVQRLRRAVNRAFVTQVSDNSIVDEDSIYLHIGRRLQRFRFDEILFLEAHGVYTKFHTTTGLLSVVESISVLENRLPKRQFMRVQKSFVINLNKLTAIEHRHVWIGETNISVGAQYRKPLQELLGKSNL